MKDIKSYRDLAPNDAYELAYEEYLADLKTAGIILRHKKSGARVCLLPNDDENKVFCAAFRTPPTDSTGVPHIIEHTVLCGSKNYPVRDPFMQLAKGSLNTFLNALTAPDMTLYPVASCNDKDFANLMHVYLDAVFFPNIYKKREIFMQEGWHYELETPEDELKINGVVYNEMKGAMSSPDRMIFEEMFAALLPDTTYAVNAGGAPDVIPTLSYEDYLAFHKRYYHPSNSYIFLYGNADMDERLRFLDEEYLSSFNEISPDSDIAWQTHSGIRTPKYVTATYPVGAEDETDGKAYLAYAFLAGSTLDVLESRACSVLYNVLFDTDSAPVKNALLDAGIGEDVYGGFEQVNDQVFTLVAKNAKAEDTDRFYRILTDTLRKTVEEGINEKALLACLNRMEFEFRLATGGGYPLGLSHLMNMMQSWLYDDTAAFSYLHTLEDIAELKAKIGTGYYEKLVKELFLDADHSILLTMTPERGQLETKEAALKEKLAAYKATLTKEEIDGIVASTKGLREYQSAPLTEEEKNCFPSLTREDIPRNGIPYKNEERSLSGVKTVYHDIETNGITYLSLAFRMDKLPRELLPYAGLLSEILCGIDTAKHTYSELDIDVRLNTGDVDFEPKVFTDKAGKVDLYFFASAKVMPEHIDYVFDMLAEVMTETNFTDRKRMTALLGEIKSEKQRYIMNSGHSVASNRAYSYFDEEIAYTEAFYGIDSYFFIKDLVEHYAEKADEVAENLRRVAAAIFDPSSLLVSLGCDEEGYQKVEAELPRFVERLNTVSHPALGERKPFVPDKKNEGILIPSQVQYVVRAGGMGLANIPYHGSYAVINKTLSLDYLFQQGRVLGGAYGCGCRVDALTGRVSFYSYRDPNLEKTDAIYKGAGEFVRTCPLDEKELTKSIIGTFSGIDRPMPPEAKITRSLNAYLRGDTTEDVNRRRAEMLDITEEEFRKGADMYDAICDEGYFCVVGNEKKLRENEGLFGALLSI